LPFEPVEPVGPVGAGPFGAWLDDVRAAIRGERDADVACGSCVGCCSSSQFVHIAPEESDALAHIPAELLFPAPGMPKGTVVMGYDEHGRCPLLGASGCTIYEHRPRTCRTYDCRVFPAAGVFPDEPEKALVAQRARRWVFDHPTPTDRARHDAVLAVAATLRSQHPDVPATPLAVRAVSVADA
jgi:hypothetical protein